MTRGTLTAPDLHPEIAMPGGDWTRMSPDGYTRPDVRAQLRTDDDARSSTRSTA
jgi:hypothetical protein